MNKLVLATLLSLSFSSAVAAEDLIVFKSTGGDFVPGKLISESDVITLADGQSVTLMSSSGNFVEIQGPYSDLPSKSSANDDKGMSDALKKLIAPSETNEGDMGVTRSATDVLRTSEQYGWVPEPWVVDVAKAGNQCVEDGRPLVLWKKQLDEVDFKLKTTNNYNVNTTWPAQVDKISAPENMPIVNGGDYTFDMNGNAVTATFHVVPAGLQPIPQAAWLEKLGCSAQAVALLQKTQ